MPCDLRSSASLLDYVFAFLGLEVVRFGRKYSVLLCFIFKIIGDKLIDFFLEKR